MKLYEVRVEHKSKHRYDSYFHCNSETYHLAAENEIEAKIKAIERFRIEQELGVICVERPVEVVESTILPVPPEIQAQPWWKRLTT